MDQNETLPSPLDLPPVESEGGELTGSVKQVGTERNPEFLPPVNPDTSTPAPSAPPASQPTHNPYAAPVQIAQQIPVHDPSAMGQSPQIADDIDLIEKEWVEKAKEIVSKTKENPYLQNKAISEIKADYIKKRYNKDLAKSEE